MIEEEWGEIRHFRASEFKAPEYMRSEVVHMLDVARERAGVPIMVTSDYRDGDDGAHGLGWAIDIADNLQGEDLASRWRYRVVKGLIAAGFDRIGVYDRHVHADADPERHPEVLWVGESQ